MNRIDCPPLPSCLIESMRNVGYSLDTALADIIDNSIAADASRISLYHECEEYGPRLAIIDDGHGMTFNELTEAMRAGGLQGPLGERKAGDMGRFGLGLKTASFSQCRRLTVVSRRKSSPLVAACWDLNELKDSWSLLIPGEKDIQSLPWINELPSEFGTMVLWESMDRLDQQVGGRREAGEIFLEHMALALDHLALVFHRFLDGSLSSARSLTIEVNRLPIQPVDPYFRKYKETQILPKEEILLHGSRIIIQPYIIPHYSRLKSSDRERLRSLGGAAATQGFYVYRNRRLLAWGDWFRIRRARTEASGLARVMIDIPNSLDDLWSLDIKKSSVSPPERVRTELRRIIDRIAESSIRTYVCRGRRLSDRKYALWQRQSGQEGISYKLDRANPLIVAFLNTLSEEGRRHFLSLLRLVEDQLPVEAIHNDRLGDKMVTPAPLDSEEQEEVSAPLLRLMRSQGIPEEQVCEVLKYLQVNT